MGPRRIIVLVLAVVIAGGAAMYARSWIEGQRPVAVAAPAPKEEIHEVLVAAASIPSGVFVKPNHLRWQRWPTKDVPATYVLKGARSQEDMVGAVVRLGIAAGEPITDGKVVKPGERGFLAAVLSPGMRAISVPTTPTSSNAGLIFPGDRVDLILTQTITEGGDNQTRRVSETVLRDLRVIAMGDETSDAPVEGKSHEKARTATLEVTPRQAEEVTLVTELGKLSLSLRSLAQGDEQDDPSAEEQLANRYTWDSDVSQVLRSSSSYGRLLVFRGSKSQDLSLQKGTE